MRVRSFTLQNPHGGGSSIGVVLYQRAFFVGQANAELAQKLMQKEPYPTGGLQIGWESGVESAHP